MARQYTRQELEGRAGREDALLVIDNLVYDVTGFLDDHPGGADVLLDSAGRDASQCFHDVGHSEDALQWREQYQVGEVVEADRWPVRRRDTGRAGREPLTLAGLLAAAWPPAALALAAWYLHSFLFP